MTFKKLVSLGMFLWLILAITKFIFINYLDTDAFFVQSLFGFFVVIFSIACSRRLGVINFLEGIFVAVFWFIVILVLDYFITSRFVGDYRFFGKWFVWIGYLLSMLAVFFFHKKRHIEIRKQQAHHGHH